MEHSTGASPSRLAKIAGAFYLITIVSRIFADGFVRDKLVRAGDAAATATNILGHATLFRWGFVADLIAFASYLALTAILYDLLKPVSRTVSLTAAYFSIAATIAQAVSSVFHLGALAILDSAGSLTAFMPGQIQTLALVAMRLRAIAYHNVGLVFLAVYCLLIGYLIFKSGFIPRLVGVLVVLAGLAYLPFAYPPLARSLLPYILIPAGVGQVSLTLWLLLFGLNIERWTKVAADNRVAAAR